MEARPGPDEQYTLRLSVRDAGGTTSQQSMPIHVQQDEKTALEPTLPITFDYRYDTVTGGSLPAGLALDRFTGAITGTPAAPGTSTFTVRLRDHDRPSTPATPPTPAGAPGPGPARSGPS
ncbi:Ig domain-containing protein [Nonomuraea sp. NPDC050783]|uniref:Ig domain-containing protein n=1 Tax=Nonomuraea sp. NPDC050783 TaxID=3154634 RepID=UPI00346617BC